LVSGKGLTRHFVVGRGMIGKDRPVVRAVESVDVTVAPGEVLGVVGESGSGKSTLGRLLLRLIEPTAGSITFDGEDVGALSAPALRRFRRNMQMVFQDPYASLNSRKTVGAALMEPLALHLGKRGRAAEEEAAVLLERVGLSADHLRRYPRAFSGGQRQRIAIARALMLNPRLLVLDEPVSALDLSVQAQVLNLLADLQDEFDLTYVFISHDLSVVRYIADDVMVMYFGEAVEYGSRDRVFSDPQHDYTKTLFAATPRADVASIKARLARRAA
jgi:dipeptide transport system ATP-binding protein